MTSNVVVTLRSGNKINYKHCHLIVNRDRLDNNISGFVIESNGYMLEKGLFKLEDIISICEVWK